MAEFEKTLNEDWKLNKLLKLKHAVGLSIGLGVVLRDINIVSFENPGLISQHARHLAYDWPDAVLFTKKLLQLVIDKTMVDLQSCGDPVVVGLAQMSLTELQFFYDRNIIPPQFSEENLKKRTEGFIADVQSFNYERIHNRRYRM